MATILLVEDEDSLRRLVERSLTHAGHRVLVAPDASTARELADAEGAAIDLLLVDVVLPDESGPKLAHGLARALAGLRVLYMSGYGPENLPDVAPQEGSLAAPTLLRKPFTPATLERRVREILEGMSEQSGT